MSSTPSILCPRCKGALAPVSGRQLRCPADGSTYELLFSRHGQLSQATPVQAAGAPPPLIPPLAPAVPHQPITAAMPAQPYLTPQYPPTAQGGGQPLPPPPGAPPVPPRTPAMMPIQPPVAAVAVPVVGQQPAPLLDGSSCQQHPAMAAVCRCSKCAGPACNTCAFWLPNGLVLCPACVVSGQESSGLTGRNKVSVYWSLGLAAAATLLPILGILIALGMGGNEELAGMAGGAVAVFGFFPSVIGLGLAAGAIRWGKKNPPLPWVGLIWNAVIVAPIILLLLIGISMS